MRTSRNRTRRRAALAFALAALLIASLPLAASAAQHGEPNYTAARKLGRGLAGMTCGFLEVPGNIVRESRARGIGYGLTLGFAVGLGKLVVRELVGVYEFVTAPFEVPPGFEPVLEPEFPWGYFESP